MDYFNLKDVTKQLESNDFSNGVHTISSNISAFMKRVISMETNTIENFITNTIMNISNDTKIRRLYTMVSSFSTVNSLSKLQKCRKNLHTF